MSEWQPIETAPKDTWVLIYMPWSGLVRQGRYNFARRGAEGWRVSFGTGSESTTIVGQPSHWMPMPEPPQDDLRSAIASVLVPTDSLPVYPMRSVEDTSK